jgi:hypothetical protein
MTELASTSTTPRGRSLWSLAQMGERKKLRQVEALNGGSLPAAAPIVNEEEFAKYASKTQKGSTALTHALSQFTSLTFCIRVGPSRREYHLHKNALEIPLLSTYAGILLHRKRGGGKEAEENTVTMDSEVDHDAFNIFLSLSFLCRSISSLCSCLCS